MSSDGEEVEDSIWAVRERSAESLDDDDLLFGGLSVPDAKRKSRGSSSSSSASSGYNFSDSDSSSDSENEEDVGAGTKTTGKEERKRKRGVTGKQVEEEVQVLSDSDSEDDVAEIDARLVESRPEFRKISEIGNVFKFQRVDSLAKPSVTVETSPVDLSPSPHQGIGITSRPRRPGLTSKAIYEKYSSAAAAQTASSSSSRATSASKEVAKVSIKFRPHPSFGVPVFQRMAPLAAPLKTTFDLICTENLNGIDRSSVAFVFDGERLADGTRPEDEDMEDGVIIDIVQKK